MFFSPTILLAIFGFCCLSEPSHAFHFESTSEEQPPDSSAQIRPRRASTPPYTSRANLVEGYPDGLHRMNRELCAAALWLMAYGFGDEDDPPEVSRNTHRQELTLPSSSTESADEELDSARRSMLNALAFLSRTLNQMPLGIVEFIYQIINRQPQ